MSLPSISRRGFLEGAAASAVLGPALRVADKAPPNIVVIMADDLGYADLSCTGSRHIRTPHIDRLAREGVTLTNGYASSPVCSPTRTALFMGNYQYRYPLGLAEPLTPLTGAVPPLPLDAPNFASAFAGLGYRTALIGKWHLNNDLAFSPQTYGYHEFFGILGGGADYHRHRLFMGDRPMDPGLIEGTTPNGQDGYLTDLLGQRAVSFIEDHRQAPFALSLHFTAPHWPWQSERSAVDARSPGTSLDLTGGSLELYREMVEILDQNVGRVMDALVRLGLDTNTVVIFTSDNGGERYSDTWPFTGGKGELLEGGIRVPTFVRWPGRLRARTVSQLASSMDFIPTLYAAAGGRGNTGWWDGINLLPVLDGSAAEIPRTLFWKMNMFSQRAARRGPWKYLKLGGDEYLFNVEQDPRERAQRQDADAEIFASLRQEWLDWDRTMLAYPSAYRGIGQIAFPDRYQESSKLEGFAQFLQRLDVQND